MKKSNNIMLGALAILVIASVISVVQLNNETGVYAYQETGSRSSNYCICHIEQYDYYGNQMGEMVQELRVRTTTGLTSDECNTRCGYYYGRASVSKSVWGEVATQ